MRKAPDRHEPPPPPGGPNTRLHPPHVGYTPPDIFAFLSFLLALAVFALGLLFYVGLP